MKPGDKVKTCHGIGEIIEKDLPQCSCWRWVIKITEPNEAGEKILKSENFAKDHLLCYFPEEVSEVCR
jgi:hypothetical protein